jgi:hypothetical protein
LNFQSCTFQAAVHPLAPENFYFGKMTEIDESLYSRQLQDFTNLGKVALI